MNVFERILYDPSQQPVVVATVPNLICLLGDGCGPLFILPQGVKLWKGGHEGQRERKETGKEKRRGKVRPPVKPPSAMLNMNLCLEAFFFSSLMLTADAAVPPSLPLSPFCSFPESSVFTPSFSSFCSAEY